MFINFLTEYSGIKAYFTDRKGGVSPSPFASLNMGYNTNDNYVTKNREIVKSALNIPNITEIVPTQVHKTDIAVIDKNNLSDKINFVGEFDGLCTKDKNILLTTCHADCLAVYLYDYKNQVIGLAHAGWKGTLGNIAEKTFTKMRDELGADITTTVSAISPGISKCCFEVGDEVYFKFKENYSYIDDYAVKKANGKYMLDLKGINLRQFNDMGINRVEISPYCTSCNTDLFYSYRKENGITGRMSAGIILI